MSIFYNEKARSFKLRAKDTDYMLQVIEGEYLGHVYYGKKVPDDDLSYLFRFDESPFTPAQNDRDRAVYLDSTPFEYP